LSGKENIGVLIRIDVKIKYKSSFNF